VKIAIVDRREPQDRIDQLKYEGFDVQVPDELLESGDVILVVGGKTVGIEIKTSSEVLSLVPSGLSSLAQFQRMATFDHRVLLIVGTFGVGPQGKVRLDGWNNRSGMPFAAVEGALFNLQANLGFLIRHAGGAKNVGRCVQNIHDFFEKEHTLLAKPRPITLASKQAPALAVLMTLPGIGSVQAERILQHYGTLARAVGQLDGWVEIPGIGAKTIENVRKFLFTEWFDAPAA
jgi:ERCC4-type nuclease